jgi:ketosteroid isomerase-like protein
MGIAMSQIFDTPQDAEDAYYDALEDGNLEALLTVWDTTDDISCLLPMHPLAQGRPAVREVFTRLFARGQGIALSVKHLGWIDGGDVAIHHVEESPQGRGSDGQPPLAVYGTNIYRHGAEGWRLIVHQNAPTAPPAGRTPPMAR